MATHNKPRECIGPCYPRNKQVLHPVTLFYVTNKDSSFCTVRPYSNNNIKRFSVKCDAPTSDNEDIPDSMFALPKLGLEPRNFLALYQIYSYEDSSTWYHTAVDEDENLEWETVRRVFDAIMLVFGEEKLPHLDDESAQVIREILERYWEPKWSRKFSLTREQIMNIYQLDTVRHAVVTYYNNAKERWHDVPSHMDLLCSALRSILDDRVKR